MTALPGTAAAGIEPSPFKPEINQLEATQNRLLSASDRIVKVLSCPPDDNMPCPDLNGAVNRLTAIDKKLVLVEGIVRSVVEEVLATPPDDNTPFRVDLIPPLVGVQAAASKIVTDIEAVLATPPDDIHPDFIAALQGVQGSAQMIVTNTQTFIRQLSGDVDCQLVTDPDECDAYANCRWIPSPTNPELGYCDFNP